MSTTHTADAVTTEVSTGVTQSTFGKHFILFIVCYIFAELDKWVNSRKYITYQIVFKKFIITRHSCFILIISIYYLY